MLNKINQNVLSYTPYKKISFLISHIYQVNYSFGWHKNSKIVIVLEIKIAVLYPNANLLFRNSENSCFSVIPWKR
jgi:hypothetical protein